MIVKNQVVVTVAVVFAFVADKVVAPNISAMRMPKSSELAPLDLPITLALQQISVNHSKGKAFA